MQRLEEHPFIRCSGYSGLFWLAAAGSEGLDMVECCVNRTGTVTNLISDEDRISPDICFFKPCFYA